MTSEQHGQITMPPQSGVSLIRLFAALAVIGAPDAAFQEAHSSQDRDSYLARQTRGD